jgi:diadenosine tetraphosphate (Ap4A) HIT family hydrolase
MSEYPTIIHERVDLARKGKNPTVITKMKSGWVVLGDNQVIPGYCILLRDPVVETINDLSKNERLVFLEEMTIIGDALIEVFKPRIVNYSILENLDKALHVHIHPRYEWEDEENKRNPPHIYKWI